MGRTLGRDGITRRARVAAVVLLATLEAGCVVRGPSPTPSPTTSLLPASVGPSAATSTVVVPLNEIHALRVTIRDYSGLLSSARPATEAELTDVPVPLDSADPAAWNPSGPIGAELRLRWGGGICDRTAGIVLAEAVRSITIAPASAPPCDAVYVGRGLGLTFAGPVDARRIAVAIEPTP